GYRNALLLRPGRYRVAGKLRMDGGGVVLRGLGDATIVATGKSRRTLIEIGGGDPSTEPAVQITRDAPAGAATFTLASTARLHPRDRIVITRPSTAEWITALEMRGLPGNYANQRLDWAPASRDLIWDRSITAIDAEHNQITIDGCNRTI